MNEYFTDIRLLPVCSCGHIIDDLYVVESVEKGPFDMHHAEVNFVPSRCPGCGKIFERIIYDRNLFKE